MSDHPLRLFLLRLFPSGQVEAHGQQRRSLTLKTSLAAIVATVIGIAVAFSLGHPVKVLADATASLIDNSPLQRIADASMRALQSTGDDQPINPADDMWFFAEAPAGAPARDQVAALPQAAGQARTDDNDAPSATLLSQFEAWAARQDAASEAPMQPAEPAPRLSADQRPAAVEAVQKHRKAKPVQNARAELRRDQRSQARVQREQNAWRLAPPVQDAHAQLVPPQQNAQPSLTQDLWWRQ